MLDNNNNNSQFVFSSPGSSSLHQYMSCYHPNLYIRFPFVCLIPLWEFYYQDYCFSPKFVGFDFLFFIHFTMRHSVLHFFLGSMYHTLNIKPRALQFFSLQNGKSSKIKTKILKISTIHPRLYRNTLNYSATITSNKNKMDLLNTYLQNSKIQKLFYTVRKDVQ